jgi:hypothetical protein
MEFNQVAEDEKVTLQPDWDRCPDWDKIVEIHG